MAYKTFKHSMKLKPAKRRYRVRVTAEVGSAGMKECVHYRCGNKIRKRRDTRPGRKYLASCGARISLRMPVEWYRSEKTVPKCRRCGAKQWVRDRYRDLKENHDRCMCNGFPWPHRLKSYTYKNTSLEYVCLHLSDQEIVAIIDKIDPIPF